MVSQNNTITAQYIPEIINTFHVFLCFVWYRPNHTSKLKYKHVKSKDEPRGRCCQDFAENWPLYNSIGLDNKIVPMPHGYILYKKNYDNRFAVLSIFGDSENYVWIHVTLHVQNIGTWFVRCCGRIRANQPITYQNKTQWYDKLVDNSRVMCQWPQIMTKNSNMWAIAIWDKGPKRVVKSTIAQYLPINDRFLTWFEIVQRERQYHCILSKQFGNLRDFFAPGKFRTITVLMGYGRIFYITTALRLPMRST